MENKIAGLRAFLDAAHSVYHAHAFLCNLLEKNGYVPLPEKEDWGLAPGEKYYVERGGTALAAFRIPKNIPTAEEKKVAPNTVVKFTRGMIPAIIPMSIAPNMPRTIPIRPPVKDIIADSDKNCVMIEDVLAPNALRIPISLVRSVTDTSIIFMTPIPPTKSEMAATNTTNTVIYPRTELICDM